MIYHREREVHKGKVFELRGVMNLSNSFKETTEGFAVFGSEFSQVQASPPGIFLPTPVTHTNAPMQPLAYWYPDAVYSTLYLDH